MTSTEIRYDFTAMSEFSTELGPDGRQLVKDLAESQGQTMIEWLYGHWLWLRDDDMPALEFENSEQGKHLYIRREQLSNLFGNLNDIVEGPTVVDC